MGYEEGRRVDRESPQQNHICSSTPSRYFQCPLQVLDDGVLTDSSAGTFQYHYHDLKPGAILDDKTVGFGKDIRLDQANMEERMFEELKKTYRPEFINRIDEKVVFLYPQARHAAGSESHGQNCSSHLAEQGMTPRKFQPSALLLATKGYDQKWCRPLRRLGDEVEDHQRKELLKAPSQEGQTIKVETTAGTIKFEIV